MIDQKRLAERHESTRSIVRFFDDSHLAEDLQMVTGAIGALVDELLDELPDGSEFTTGLRKLLEAKDCFVRHAVVSRNESRNA